MEIIEGRAYSLNEEKNIACRFLTVDAYSGAHDFYLKCGFVDNSHPSPYKDSISMRRDLFDSRRKPR